MQNKYFTRSGVQIILTMMGMFVYIYWMIQLTVGFDESVREEYIPDEIRAKNAERALRSESTTEELEQMIRAGYRPQAFDKYGNFIGTPPGLNNEFIRKKYNWVQGRGWVLKENKK